MVASMLFQINRGLNTLAGKPKAVAMATAQKYHEWETVEGDLYGLAQKVREGHWIRLAVKADGNKKSDIKEGVSGIGVDVDTGTYSLHTTRSLIHSYKSIIYVTCNGHSDQDATPHRVFLPFSKPVSISQAEAISKYVHTLLTGKSHASFDAAHAWLSTTAELINTIEINNDGLYLDELPTHSTSAANDRTAAKAEMNGSLAIGIKMAEIKSLDFSDSKEDSKAKSASKKTKKDKPTLVQTLDLFWSNHVLNSADINAQIYRITGIDFQYRMSGRAPAEGGEMQLDGGHWDGSLHHTGELPNSSTLTLMTAGNFLWYSRRDSVGLNFVQFLCKATQRKNPNFSLVTRLEPSELLKWTLDKCNSLGIEPPNLTLTPEYIWDLFVHSNADKLRFMPKLGIYAYYQTRVYTEVYSGVDYNARRQEKQSCWITLKPKEMVTVVDSFNAELFKNHLTAKDLKDIAVLVNYSHGHIEQLFEYPLDSVLPTSDNKLWHLREQKLVEADSSYYYWNPSTLPFLEGEKEQETSAKFIELLKLITPESEHSRHDLIIDWLTLWLVGAAFNTQAALYMYGEGGAGKSTITNWFSEMVGGSVTRTRENILLKADKKFGFEKLAEAPRLILDEFTGKIDKGNLPFLKDLIAPSSMPVYDSNGRLIEGAAKGGTAIQVEIKNGGFDTLYATLSTMINGQSIPTLPETDEGWPRRFLFLKFRSHKPHTDLFAEISENLPYLRSWLLKRDWKAALKRVQTEVRKPEFLRANRALLHGNSAMGDYIATHIDVIPEEDYPTSRAELYADWSRYCTSQMITPGIIGKFIERFTDALKNMGLADVDAMPLTVKKADANRNYKPYLRVTIKSL